MPHRKDWLTLSTLIALACARSGPTAEEQVRADAERERKTRENVERTLEPYRRAALEFWRATAAGELESAYKMLARSYTNMVSEEAFAAGIKTNKNFEKPLDVKVLHTRSQAGTTRARCIAQGLGLVEITFADTPGGPRISAISIGGMPALPASP